MTKLYQNNDDVMPLMKSEIRPATENTPKANAIGRATMALLSRHGHTWMLHGSQGAITQSSNI